MSSAQMEAVRAHLVLALQVAIPLWIQRRELWRHNPFQLQQFASEADERMQVGADDLLYGGPRQAASFNSLAEALACAVLLDPPGGVVAFGMHWRERSSRPCTGLRSPACPECAAELARDQARQVAG